MHRFLRRFLPSSNHDDEATEPFDPATHRRDSFTTEDEDDVPPVAADELRGIVQDMEQARVQLAQAEEKERFIGMRLYKYRTDLHDRRRQLEESVPQLQSVTAEPGEDDEDDTDLEDGNTTARDEARLLAVAAAKHAEQRQKWEQDCQALEKVELSHRNILMYCETMRRNLHTLELKRDACEKLLEECGYPIGSEADGEHVL